jgi:hypothetical protein
LLINRSKSWSEWRSVLASEVEVDAEVHYRDAIESKIKEEVRRQVQNIFAEQIKKHIELSFEEQLEQTRLRIEEVGISLDNS